jgi:cell division protein FtsA
MRRRPELLVGIDIGTAKVAAAVGEPAAAGGLSIAGSGLAPCEGLRKGVVVNMEATVQAIASAVKEAELRAGCEIHSVFASVGGGHIKGFNSHGVVALKSREVAVGDVERVLDAARAVALPPDQDVLHVLPQEFLVDGQDGIKEPVGMSGVRLEARVHIVSTAVASAQNVIKCCQRAGLHVAELAFAPVAAAEAVLTAEERELGVALVDVGAGTTGLLIFAGGASRTTSRPGSARRFETPRRSSAAPERRWSPRSGTTRWSRCPRSAGARRASSRAVRSPRSSSPASRRSSPSPSASSSAPGSTSPWPRVWC